MKIYDYPCALLAAILLFASCQKSVKFDGSTPVPVDSIPSKPPVSSEPDKLIVTSLMGRILDEKGDPMKDAEVSAGSRMVVTDQYGIFRIQEVTVSEQSSFISVKKSGYLMGSRTVVSQAGGNAFMQIKMVRKVLKASFNAGDGASIYIANSASVKFPANAITDAAGELYRGRVFVYGTLYDPTTADFNDIMPGDLRGITADSQATALKSYGMINVVLETEAGEALQLAKGKTAQIAVPVASGLVSSAPGEIPLWHFSEVDGKWREEGKAVFRDGIYHGEVSHFSTWNCDVPYKYVFVKINVRSLKGVSVPYSRVTITDKQTGSWEDGYTDSLGSVTMPVPKDQPLEIRVLNECYQVLGVTEVGKVTSDNEIIIVTIKQDNLIYVTGTVTSCGGERVAAGNVSLYTEGLHYGAKFENGEFYLYLNHCWKDVHQANIYVQDNSNLNGSGGRNIEISGPRVDAGNFEVCGNVSEEYARFKFGNDSILLAAPPDSTAFFRYINTVFGFYHRTGSPSSDINLNCAIPMGAGVAASVEFNLEYKGTLYSPSSDIECKVDVYGEVGEYIHCTFSGFLHRNQVEGGPPIPISGEVRIVRKG